MSTLKQYVASAGTVVDPVEDPHRDEWRMLDALMGGTKTMRAAGEALLPKWPGEEGAAYTSRLNSSTLYNVFKRTISVLEAKPFSSPPTIDGADAEITSWLDDVDMQGRNLVSFGKEVMRTGLTKGLAHILVDFPRVDPGATLADERAIGARPYFVSVKPEQVLSWFAQRINGAQRLTSVTLQFYRYEPRTELLVEGDVKRVEQRLVITRGEGSCPWTLYEQTVDGKGWEAKDEGAFTVTEIPLVTFYAERIDFMVARPPLLDLAYLNVQHWQSSSDQDNILHVARVPILFGAGFEEGDGITVGAASAVRTNNSQATLTYVEHTGAAVEAGRTSLQDIEARMSALGADLLLKRQTGDKTATEAALEGASATCDLAAMVEALEDAFNLGLEFMAEYSKKPKAGTVTLFKDFAVDALGANDLDTLIRLNSIGALSAKTLIEEAKRRKLLSDEVTYEDEQATLDEETTVSVERSMQRAAGEAAGAAAGEQFTGGGQ